MDNYKHIYVNVSCDVQPEGFNMVCWMSPVDVWHDAAKTYPNYYDRGEGLLIWHIRSNCELTNKAVSMIVEYAGGMLADQVNQNLKRKVANR